MHESISLKAFDWMDRDLSKFEIGSKIVKSLKITILDMMARKRDGNKR